MCLVMHSASRDSRCNFSYLCGTANQERIKQEVKATYQVNNKGDSPRHGLMLMSSSYYQNNLNQILFREQPVLPYREALSRRPQYQLQKIVRSRSTPKRMGDVSDNNARSNTEVDRTKASNSTIQNQSYSRAGSALKKAYNILPESEQNDTERQQMTQFLDQLKQNNQQAFSQWLKERNDNKRIGKVVLNTRSKPLDVLATIAALPKIIQPQKNKTSKRYLNTSSSESDPLAMQETSQRYYITESHQGPSRHSVNTDRSHFHRSDSASKERVQSLTSRTINEKNRPGNSNSKNEAMSMNLNLALLKPQQQQLATQRNPLSTEESHREKVKSSQNTLRRASPDQTTTKKSAHMKNVNSSAGRRSSTKRSKSESKFLQSYFNPLYRNGELVTNSLLHNYEDSRPRIAKKFKNSVSIKYPNVHVEPVTQGKEEESSFDDTSVDTDTYQYYDAVHKEYYQPKNMKRAERYDHLMKMNIAEVFRDVYEEVDRVKKV